MQRSLIDRVFPKPKKPLLPQYDEQLSTYHDEDPLTRTARSTESTSITSILRGTTSRHDSDDRGSESHNALQTTPFGASLMHHDDPFLAVDRAATRLQQTIQSLLDFQSECLSGRHKADVESSAMFQGSATPTLSVTQASLTVSTPYRVEPKRQPKRKPLTLKGTRRAIGESMHELAKLKEEELKLTTTEQKHRQAALQQVSSMESKTAAVQHELGVLKERAEGDQSRTLRTEAHTIDVEIHELENRLLELKTRRRHLLEQATQIESAAASEISSYEGTLRSIEKQKQKFLQNPPVSHGLGPRSFSTNEAQDMYVLHPQRRTLELAKEQWSSEIQTLKSRGAAVELEYQALNDGVVLWNDIISSIDRFERTLRQKMKENDARSLQDLVSLLDSTTQHLQSTLSLARAREWKLLICALGAELDAFRQARILLSPDDALPSFYEIVDRANETAENIANESASLHLDSTMAAPSSNSSNESLKATLRQFSPSKPAIVALSNGTVTDSGQETEISTLPQTSIAQAIHSESEDDEPGPDFLISHTD